MSNMLDYIEWRGDLPFSLSPFCEVDAMILSRISNIAFDGIVSENMKNTIKIKDAADIYFNKPVDPEKVLFKTDNECLELLKESERFSALKLCGYVNQVDEEKQKQFSAIIIELSKNLHFISFRGTDNSVVGWKEDLNMAYITPVPAQKSAQEYFLDATKVFNGTYILGGHSKGGNLAVYAAATCNTDKQLNISEVYNFDGPGFQNGFLETPGYKNIEKKVHTYIPQSSVVGMLLDHEDNYIITKSNEVSIMQHDLYTWEVIGDSIVKQNVLTQGSVMINKTLKNWLSEMNNEQRKNFINTLYDIFEKSDIRTLRELNENRSLYMGKIFKTISDLDSQEKMNIASALALLIRSAVKIYNG